MISRPQSAARVASLGIFAKAPVPGRVKTRLAAEIGPSGAAEVYWRMGRQVVVAIVHAFAQHFADGAERVVVIGTDCPAVPGHSLVHRDRRRADPGPRPGAGLSCRLLRALRDVDTAQDACLVGLLKS